MKLYYKPGACSLAPHIALRAAGADFALEKVDTKAQKTETGEDYRRVTTKGYVPALRLANGEVLTEAPAVLQYIADRHPEAKLAPEPGTLERARLQEQLNFVSSELHKAYSPFFHGALSDEARSKTEEGVAKRLAHFETLLSDGRPFLLGDTFTVADAYFFVVTNWSHSVGIDLARWPNVAAYMKRTAQLEPVREAMQAEGLAARPPLGRRFDAETRPAPVPST